MTLAGSLMSSRVAASQMSAVGLEMYIARGNASQNVTWGIRISTSPIIEQKKCFHKKRHNGITFVGPVNNILIGFVRTGKPFNVFCSDVKEYVQMAVRIATVSRHRKMLTQTRVALREQAPYSTGNAPRSSLKQLCTAF